MIRLTESEKFIVHALEFLGYTAKAKKQLGADDATPASILVASVEFYKRFRGIEESGIGGINSQLFDRLKSEMELYCSSEFYRALVDVGIESGVLPL